MFNTLIILIYFVLVLIAKLQADNQQYFQIAVSFLWTLLNWPIEKLLLTLDSGLFLHKLMFNSLTLFILGVSDIGLQDEFLLRSLQYCLLGYHLRQYMQTELEIQVQLNKSLHIIYWIVILAAFNVQYLLNGRSTIGSIFGVNVILLMCLFKQIYDEFNADIQANSSKSTGSKKVKSKSLTERVDSHNKYQQSHELINDEEPHQMQVHVLGNGAAKKIIDESRSLTSNKNIDLQKNFYKILFNQFPEGMIILDARGEIEYHNNQVFNWFKTKDKNVLIHKIQALKNYQNKCQEQAQFSKLFKLIRQKSKDTLMHDEVSQSAYSEQDDEKDEFLESQLSTHNTLGEEIKNALLSIRDQSDRSQILNRSNSVFTETGKLKFRYEVKMLCLMVSEEEEDKVNVSLQQEEQEDIQENLAHITIKPYIFEGKGQILIMIRDVSVFNQYKVLQQVNQRQLKWLYWVSHELRTPLNCILAISNQLIDKNLYDQDFINTYLKPLMSSANLISGLVNDLLDLAQVNKGKFQLNFCEFELENFLIEISTQMSFQVLSKQLTLSLFYDQNIPKLFKSDKIRISQIVMNLIQNAIKFTSRGGITLQATLIANKLVEISVTDTGLGIKEDEIPKLFKAFGKLDDNKNINPQGVGLGLQISNKIARKLNQTDEGLKVESEGFNKGTKFSFVLYDWNEKTLEKIQTVTYNSSENRKQLGRKESTMSIVYVGNNANNHTTEPMSASIFKPKTFRMKSEKKIDSDAYRKYHFQIDENQQSQHKFLSKYSNIHKYTTQGVIREIIATPPSKLNCEFNHFEGQQSSKSSKRCNCKQVLIVDDDHFGLKGLEMMIQQSLKLECNKAYNGYEALAILNQYQNSDCCKWPKYIFLDYQMPVMSGLETAKKIRAMEQQNQQKSYIICLSGYSDQDSKQECYNAGMDAFLTKPPEKATLIHAIQKI